MDSIRSYDGTRIAFTRLGAGAPLLLVHGAGTDHSASWRFVLPRLAQRFAVHAMDRRGRGGSGDAAAYHLQREAEDVAAIVDGIGGPVDVVGHSYGGLCALEASLLTSNVHRLILYESVPVRAGEWYRPGLIEELESLLAAGDVERMLEQMMREVVGRSADEIEALRSDREGWAARLAIAPTVPRELRADAAYAFDRARFVHQRARTVLLVGEDSPERERRNAVAVARGLPDAHVEPLPGQHHIAMITAPELFVETVERCLGVGGSSRPDRATRSDADAGP